MLIKSKEFLWVYKWTKKTSLFIKSSCFQTWKRNDFSYKKSIVHKVLMKLLLIFQHNDDRYHYLRILSLMLDKKAFLNSSHDNPDQLTPSLS